MSRIEQINELIKEKLAILISREIPLENGLITISHVDCSPDLKTAKIGISVLPEKYFGTALKSLRKQNSLFSQALRRELRLHHIPKFIWFADDTEKNAAEIEKVFDEIKKERGE